MEASSSIAADATGRRCVEDHVGSASPRGRARSGFEGKRRPEYERLLADVRDGRIGAVIAWHPQRLDRHPKDLETFLTTVEGAGAAAATVQAGELDLSSPSGRMVARMDTVAKVREAVTRNGGALEYAWQTGGIYDFVAVLNFPDLQAEFRSRNEVYKLGTITVDHVPAIPLEDALQLTSG